MWILDRLVAVQLCTAAAMTVNVAVVVVAAAVDVGDAVGGAGAVTRLHSAARSLIPSLKT